MPVTGLVRLLFGGRQFVTREMLYAGAQNAQGLHDPIPTKETQKPTDMALYLYRGDWGRKTRQDGPRPGQEKLVKLTSPASAGLFSPLVER